MVRELRVVKRCRAIDARCVQRQSCFAQDVGMNEYCSGTFETLTGFKALVVRWGFRWTDWRNRGH